MIANPNDGKIGEISGDSSWVSSLADAVKQNSDVVLLSEPHEYVSVFGDMYELSELNDGYYVVMFEAVEDGKQIIFTSPGFGFGFDYISRPAQGDGYMFDTYNSNISIFSWQNFGYTYGFSLEPYSGRPCYMYVPKGAVVVYEHM